MAARDYLIPVLLGAVAGLALRAALPGTDASPPRLSLEPPPKSVPPASVMPPPPAAPRKPHAPPQPGELREMEIKDLGNFEYDPVKPGTLPADVKALEGLNVKLRGYMAPLTNSERVTDFVLVPSLLACCYGMPPQVQHMIVCQTVKGMSVPYYPEEVNVVGKLKVAETQDEGFVISIFEMQVTSVQPAPVGPLPAALSPAASAPAAAK